MPEMNAVLAMYQKNAQKRVRDYGNPALSQKAL